MLKANRFVAGSSHILGEGKAVNNVLYNIDHPTEYLRIFMNKSEASEVKVFIADGSKSRLSSQPNSYSCFLTISKKHILLA